MNLAIRNFLVAIELFLNAKSSLSLWIKWQISHRKWFLNTNLFLIKPFLIAKFDCITKVYNIFRNEIRWLSFSRLMSIRKLDEWFFQFIQGLKALKHSWSPWFLWYVKSSWWLIFRTLSDDFENYGSNLTNECCQAQFYCQIAKLFCDWLKSCDFKVLWYYEDATERKKMYLAYLFIHISYKDKRTEVWCIYTQIFSQKKPPFFHVFKVKKKLLCNFLVRAFKKNIIFFLPKKSEKTGFKSCS